MPVSVTAFTLFIAFIAHPAEQSLSLIASELDNLATIMKEINHRYTFDPSLTSCFYRDWTDIIRLSSLTMVTMFQNYALMKL